MGRGYKILSERVFIGLRHGESWYDRESEDAENLTKEGRHKKNLLGAVAWTLVGVCLGALPFTNWEICAEQPIAAVIVESAAIGAVVYGKTNELRYTGFTCG